MGLKEDLQADATRIFGSSWKVETTEKVPDPEDLALDSNHAKDLSRAVVLYADLDGSTQMVDKESWEFSAEIYEAFLKCSAKIIRSLNGTVTAYDGDRVMGIFVGDLKHTSAVKSAMQINWAVDEIITPLIKKYYSGTSFSLKHVIGIDSSRLRTARIGVRLDNDLVWIGRAANYAAKLTGESGKRIWITKDVYENMQESVKLSSGVNMWTPSYWSTMNNMIIYGSNYRWKL